MAKPLTYKVKICGRRLSSHIYAADPQRSCARGQPLTNWRPLMHPLTSAEKFNNCLEKKVNDAASQFPNTLLTLQQKVHPTALVHKVHDGEPFFKNVVYMVSGEVSSR